MIIVLRNCSASLLLFKWHALVVKCFVPKMVDTTFEELTDELRTVISQPILYTVLDAL